MCYTLTRIASYVMFVIEKISLCGIAALLVSCTVFTITFVLAFGIGLGYNYCFVDLKTRYRHVPARYRYGGSPIWHSGSRYVPLSDASKLDKSPQDADNEKNYESEISLDDIKIPDAPIYDTLEVHYTDDMNVMHTTMTSLQRKNVTDKIMTSLQPKNVTDKTMTSLQPKNVTDKIMTSLQPKNVTDTTMTSLKAKNVTETLKTSKMVIPLSGLDLIGLLTRLRAENKNYTLQIVTD